MIERRPNAIQILFATAGLVLAVAGVVRFAQGRPDRTTRNVSSTPVTTTIDSTVTESSPDTSGASDSTGAIATTPGTVSDSFDVDIAGFAFAPDPLTIPKGTKVTWTNRDTFTHTATGDDTSIFDSKSLKTGESFSHTFATAGTFTYKCAIHNSMTGTVIVG